MYERLIKVVANLKSPRILLVGDFMLDIYTYGDALRISPEAPVPVLKITKTEYSGGGASSVAMDLAALEAKVTCIGIIGNDANGEKLKKILSNPNIDTSGIIVSQNRPTISKQRLIGLAQHRHQQQLFRMDNEVTDDLSTEETSVIIETYKKHIKDCDIVCLQDYNKGLLTNDVCSQMIEIANKENKKVLVDPSPTSDYSKYKSATLITPNRKETSIAVGFAVEDMQNAAQAAKKLHDDLNLQAAVITLDKEGAYLYTSDFNGIIPTRPRNVYDVTGAGDMVLATIAVVLAAGNDYKTAVELSNIAGGLEVEKFGVATVSIDEIINEIIGQNRGKTGKLKTLENLCTELKWHRSQKEKIVFTNGCFDILHRGHIEYLKFCKEQGNIVVVGLNSDSSVKKIKGPERPLNNQHDRAAILAALESVDYITIFDEPDPLELIKKTKPDVLVKGEDWAQKGVVGQEFVEANGGKVVLAKFVKDKSSTSIIEKIKSLLKKE
ncbi:MAG: D-glycero-beta-D-manno-heptose 1-phosphate adenylyltransferase [Planctomycetes bacterium]|nr:D-glycero-beta-D-manno-heptose 1-phosphate adenylyltransferase [Planctomycetota bacterium]